VVCAVFCLSFTCQSDISRVMDAAKKDYSASAQPRNVLVNHRDQRRTCHWLGPIRPEPQEHLAPSTASVGADLGITRLGYWAFRGVAELG